MDSTTICLKFCVKTNCDVIVVLYLIFLQLIKYYSNLLNNKRIIQAVSHGRK